jgi:5-methylcytosine-specific restriction endonuclease McrA
MSYEDRRNMDPILRRIKKFRSGPAWQAFAKLFKKRNPVCCDPWGEHGEVLVPMDDVHHVVPLAEDMGKGLDPDNCRPLCRSCHNRVSAIERTNAQAAKDVFK